MEQVKIHSSRLFVTSSVENKDDLEERFERSYQFLQSVTSGLSDKDAHDALNNALLKDKGYEEISLGLLVTILTEPHNAAKSYRDLTLITRDGFGLILTHLSQLVLDRYLRLNDTAKLQLIWLLREMIKNSVSNVDSLCWNLMRQAAGGDTSTRNINLVESLLDIYIEYRSWLVKFPVLLAAVVYTYLRLVEDHMGLYLSSLRQKEVGFLISLLREKFGEFISLGRDLVRLLQNVARIPEFEQLWKDILLNPKSLCPTFNGVLQLLQTRTSRKYLQARLTPDMERKLAFLTGQVRFGHHKRYQDWFQRQYLATPESQSLRCDMIRFIVSVIHPTNELLSSDVIPRWAVIGWLLTTCTSSVAVSNAKLALFYDWFFYDYGQDTIMNIEPAILVMYNSVRSHPAISATLLDFLCRIIANFYPPLTERIRSGIFASLREILDKRVLPSFSTLFDNAKLDRDLRNLVRETFKEFCIPQLTESSSKVDNAISTHVIKLENEEVSNTRINNIVNNHVLDNEPAFSDEEDDQPFIIHTPEDDTDDDDIPLAKVRLKEKTQDKGDELIEGPLKSCLVRFQSEKNKQRRCDTMEIIIHKVLEYDADSDVITAVSKCLCIAIQEDIQSEIFPPTLKEESLVESIKMPLFILYRSLYNLCKNDDTGKHVLYKLLAEMYGIEPSIGYLLLYFLKVHIRTERVKDEQTKVHSLKVSVYKEFCHCIEKKLDICLYEDLNLCHLRDTNLLVWIVPDIFKDFKLQTVSNAQILRVIVSSIDAQQLQELIFLIMQGNLVMVKSDNLIPLLKSSLLWETIEQYFLWQLIHAHDVSLDSVLPIMPFLESPKHSEALMALTLMLKKEKPTADFIKYLFSRDVREDDNFIFTIIKYWCRDYSDKVGEFISNLISTRYPATSPNKRKRTANKSLSSTVPSADQVLGHLDHYRNFCEIQSNLTLFNTEVMQRALQLANSNSSESQRKQFRNLFALTDEEDSSTSKSKSQRGRKASTKTTGKRSKDISESSEDSSEDEEIVKPKQAKKRKKVMSDSD